MKSGLICYILAVGSIALLPMRSAVALEYTFDDGTVLRLDNTVKLSGAIRTQSPNAQSLNINTNDGQLAFPKGHFVSGRVDLLSEFDVTHNNFGFTGSVAAWYDGVYNTSNSNNSPATFNGLSRSDNFPNDTTRIEGRDIEVLNAFAHGDFRIANMPLTLRAGQYALQWGEAIFTPESIAATMSPTDILKATGVPGAQIKEIILPVPQVSFNLQITPKLSIEGYTQFEFRPDRLPASDSFFEFSDFLGNGGARILTGANPFNPNVPLSLYKGKTENGRTFGQFGVAVRFHPITDLDLGLYLTEFDDKIPQIYTRVPTFRGVPVAFLPQNIPNTATNGQLGIFNEGYARNIQAAGASASTSYGPINFGFETSVRLNQDLQSTNLSLLPGQNASFGDDSLYARGTTLHYLANALYIGEPSRLWNGITVIGEVSGSHLMQITANKQNFNPLYNHNNLGLTTSIDPQYFQVLPALDIDFPITVGWNIQGNGPWNSGYNYATFYGGYASVGVNAVYQSVWRGGVQFTHFLGSSGYNATSGILSSPFLGRDFVSFNVQRTF